MAFEGGLAALLFGGAGVGADLGIGAGAAAAAAGLGDVVAGGTALGGEELLAALAAGGGAASLFGGGGGADAAALAAGGGSLAGEAGAFGAGIPTTAGATSAFPAAIPDLALPGSTLPGGASLSAASAAPEFPAITSASDPFAAWGSSVGPSQAGGVGGAINPASTPWWTSTVNPADFATTPSAIGDASSGFPSLAAQSAGVTPGAASGDLATAGAAAPTSMTQTPFAAAPQAAGGGGAAAAPTSSGVSTDALSSITAGQTAAAPTAPAAPGAAPAAAAGSPSGGGGGGIMDWIKANPVMAASLGIGGGMLAKNAISPAKLPNQNQLDQIAQQAQAMSAQNQSLEARLLDPLTSGNLPAAQQKQVDMALQDAITSIRSKFAGMGMSGSSVEQDEIANARNKSIALAGTLAEQMAQAGLSAGSQAASSLQIAGTIYEQLMQTQIQQDTALQQAIAAFAGQAAIAGAISTGQRKAA